MKEIKIPESLRDYVERLHYEAVRYKDLLATVRRDSCPMTDGEWQSSLEYYQDLCLEAQTCLNLAMEEVGGIYAKEIGGETWRVDFPRCSIVCGDAELPPPPDYDEQYADQLQRLFHSGERRELAVNDGRAKDITLQVTDACNMACTYCYQHHKGCHAMSFETGKAFLDMLLDADERTNTYITSTKCDGVILNFIGGEPWLEAGLIERLSDYFIGELFRRKHPWAITFMFGVCSNGLLHFEPEVQDYLKRHGGHLSYSISIDGNRELHDSCRVDLAGNGTYDRAMDAVRQYREVFGGRIGSKMTIAPGNVCMVKDAAASMIENGYRMIHLNCVYEEGWNNSHAAELYRQLKGLTDWLFEHGLEESVSLSVFSRHCGHPLGERDNGNWCGGTGLMLAVDWKGDIFPCLRYMESSVGEKQPPFLIGTIRDGINRLPEHVQRVNCLSCITRRSQSTDECWSCPIAQGCAWCSAYNYECFGTPDKRAVFICCMHKARALANVYYWRKRGFKCDLDCPEDWAVPVIGKEEYQMLAGLQNGGRE